MPPGRRPGREAGQRRLRGRVEQDGQARRGHQPGRPVAAGQGGDLREPGPPGLLGRGQARRPPAGQRPVAAVAAPLDHAPLGRPRHDHVHPDLGHGLGGQFAAVALGQRLEHGQPRHRRRLGPAGQHGQLELAVPAAGHLAFGHRAGAVGHVHVLPGAQPADRGGVPALGAGQHDQVAGQLSRIGQEDRRPHRSPVLPGAAGTRPAAVSGR
jgi:hypothetical protein